MPPKKSTKSDTASINVNFDLDNIISELPQPDISGGKGNKTTANSAKPVKAYAASTDAPLDMENYTEINKAGWMSIPVDTYIRYIDTDGKWRPGARLKSIRQNPDGTNSFVIGKFNPFIKKYTKWNVPFNNVSELYKMHENVSKEVKMPKIINPNVAPEVVAAPSNDKESAEEQILGKLGNKLLFDDGEIMRHKVEGLEAEVQRMSEDLKNLLTLIKRIYNRLERAGVP